MVMFLAMTNKSKRLLYLGYIQQVRTKDLQRGLEEMPALLADLPPGFHLLVDLGRLESMEPACSMQIGKVMELCDQHGVGLVIRVIPDPAKDIGFNMLSIFHYPHRPQMVTCESMSEAARLLSL
jgi:anti-anti-sigma regulatory factor